MNSDTSGSRFFLKQSLLQHCHNINPHAVGQSLTLMDDSDHRTIDLAKYSYCSGNASYIIDLPQEEEAAEV